MWQIDNVLFVEVPIFRNIGLLRIRISNAINAENDLSKSHEEKRKAPWLASYQPRRPRTVVLREDKPSVKSTAGRADPHILDPDCRFRNDKSITNKNFG